MTGQGHPWKGTAVKTVPTLRVVSRSDNHELYVVVRYLLDQGSDGGNADRLEQFRTCDLVDVQIPVQMTMPDREAVT